METITMSNLPGTIVDWMPILLLLLLWPAYRIQRDDMRRRHQHMDRMEALLERVAVALERRVSDLGIGT
jgi:hypothetical protein